MGCSFASEEKVGKGDVITNCIEMLPTYGSWPVLGNYSECKM